MYKYYLGCYLLLCVIMCYYLLLFVFICIYLFLCFDILFYLNIVFDIFIIFLIFSYFRIHSGEHPFDQPPKPH